MRSRVINKRILGDLKTEGPVRGIVHLDPSKHRSCPSLACRSDIQSSRRCLMAKARTQGLAIRTSVDPRHGYVIALEPKQTRQLLH